MPGEDKKADGKFEKEKLIDRAHEWSECSCTINQFSDLFLEIIIFYGHNIDCYCALQGLLEFGVDGSWITLIHPPLAQCKAKDEAFFDDCEVYTEVMESITRNNIKIIMGWELINWNLENTSNGKMIESIIIKSKGKSKVIYCDFLINFYEKTIGMKIFLAICRSGLMFDGQLVIDSDLRTNDPSIFAAGTITKYCRRYYSESWQHKNFNRIEIGEKLAKIIRSFIENEHQGKDPASIPSKRKAFESVYVFRLPLIVACIVPGGYRFLYVRKCGKSTPRKIAIRFDIYGQVLITGSCKTDMGYFRIRLNRFNVVETITCFNKKNFEVDHICSLWGKHESLLNNLKARFKVSVFSFSFFEHIFEQCNFLVIQESLIVDFFEYFREPWALAIFYDKFNCLRVENRATLLSKTAISGQSLINDCIHALIRSKWEEIQKNDLQTIQSRFAGSVYQQEIEENLLDFLQFCQEDLPMYCTPDKLIELYEEIKDSPLYNF
ncbi:cilia- and flagella-associated protein 61-like isoform X2 [Apis dorsata]|uniref:cilia- and flagella-associated protein 61-like isoform X2 n=1 Tax=Apis dorsata TaxID=7462 RepID=UPI001293130C|nr:cilia- and flagella-associated protein 61-like isoform X2 [Apis dorsata]